jgi:hypothetical protein
MSEPHLEPPGLGPRKRKESSRVTDNADPLLPKNKKKKVAPKANPNGQAKARTAAAAAAHTASGHHSSVEVEGVADKANVVRNENPLSLSSPEVIVGPADGNDDIEESSPAPVWIDVDGEDSDVQPEDSASDELRACTTDSNQKLLSFL